MPLKPDEKRYAMNRVKEIKQARIQRLVEKHTKASKPPNDRTILRLLRQWDFSWKSSTSWNLKTPIGDCIELHDEDLAPVTDEKALNRDKEKLRKEVAKVTDEIMLGDAETARKLLDKFEATV